MPDPFSLFGIGAGLLGGIGKAIFGGGQRREARRIASEWQPYTTSPYAKQQLGIAQQLFGGRMPGAASQEQNIASSQAGTIANINRNATDSSQALALAGQAQGQANQAYSSLGIEEAKNKQAMLSNLDKAYETMVNEGDKEYQSKLQKYMMDVQQQQALAGGGAQNIFGGIGDIASLGILSGQLFGGAGKLGWGKMGRGAVGTG